MSMTADTVDQCTACQALCCVAPYYHPSISFAEEKAQHTPCRHLAVERFRCTIHAQLSECGFQGCVDFRCYGAGPELSALAAEQGITWPALAQDDARRGVLFEQFLELQSLYAALAELRELAEGAGLGGELTEYEAQIVNMSTAQRLARGLELAVPIRLLCWQATLGDDD